jgi:3-oxoacyl-[acyl-carrier protein] reductase
VKRLGLPDPPVLRRYRPGDPPMLAPVLLGGAGRLLEPTRSVLKDVLAVDSPHEIARSAHDSARAPDDAEVAALVFDATAIAEPAAAAGPVRVLPSRTRIVTSGGRVVVLGSPPEECRTPEEATAQRALEGFVRSVGKEFGRGITAQLVLAARDAESNLDSTLRFLLSHKSAYVSGQVIRIAPAAVVAPEDWEQPLAGKVVVVTGAARGIGESIARVLARDGAHVVCVDVPAAGDALATVANTVRGEALQVDLTSDGAPRTLADHLVARHGGLDVIVHNAGITRDKTLGRMSPEQWDAVLAVNLLAPQRLNATLLEEKLFRRTAASSVSPRSPASRATGARPTTPPARRA